MEDSLPSRCVIVLTIPRSGSSLVAGILHTIGVDMGEGHLQPADGNNKLGYFEDLRWQALHKRITGIRYGTAQPPDVSAEQKLAYKELADECQRKPIWGMKCPRLCFTLHWITPHLTDARLVIVRRNFEASVSSLVRHSQVSYKGELRMDPSQARAVLSTWRDAMERQIAVFDGPKLEVSYRPLLKEPMAWVRALNSFARENTAAMPASDKQIDRAVQFCKRDMNHNG